MGGSDPEPFPKGVPKLQSEMVIDARGNLLVDFIGAYENLQEDFDEITRILGIRAVLPHVNQSVHRDYPGPLQRSDAPLSLLHLQARHREIRLQFFDGNPPAI